MHSLFMFLFIIIGMILRDTSYFVVAGLFGIASAIEVGFYRFVKGKDK